MNAYPRLGWINVLAISAAIGIIVGCNGDDPQRAAGTIEVASKPKGRADFKALGKEAKAARRAKEKFDVKSKLKALTEGEPAAEPR